MASGITKRMQQRYKNLHGYASAAFISVDPGVLRGSFKTCTPCASEG